jgi:NodT family efflux transporter outer membrane factor (OMF) lipoprotein
MWWETFEDPVLNQLIQTVHEQNLTLRSAGMRVLVARAQRGVAIGGLFPQQQGHYGQYQRTRLSVTTNGLGQLIEQGFPIGREFDTWSTGVDMAWELDIWGKFRRGIEAADANLDASVEDYDAILVSLLAETASTYVEYRTYHQQLAYAKSNVEIQKGSLGIAEAQFEGGRVSELDVTQALANLKNTEQLVPLFEAQVRDANNRLCVLLGVPVRDLSPELGDATIPTAAPEVAVGIPADLLRRRPDVRAAERRVAAQCALIGVAAADLFPHFSITGAITLDSQRFKDLFSSASSGGIVAPGFRWDILNYGRLVNRVRGEEAVFQDLAYQYQQAVLNANREAETAITAFLKAQERLVATREAVDASSRSVEIVTLQYREGAVDFNRVFNLQLLLVQDQDRYAQTQGDVARALIAIYRSLGGGWEIRGGYVPSVLPAAPEAAAEPQDIPAGDDIPALDEPPLPDAIPMPQEPTPATR